MMPTTARPLLLTIVLAILAAPSLPQAAVAAERPAWSRPAPLARDQRKDMAAATVGVAGDGTSLVLWRTRSEVRLRQRSATGDLGPVETISAPEKRGLIDSLDSIAVAANGTALAMWSVRKNGAGVPSGRFARLRDPDGRLGPVRQLDDDPDQSQTYLGFFGPDDGNPRVVSDRYSISAQRSSMLVQTLDPAGGLIDGAVWDQQWADESTAAVDAAGNAVIVWLRDDRFGRTTTGDVRLYAVTLSRAGVLGSPQTVAVMHNCCVGIAPAVSVSPNGRGHVVWTQPADENGDERMQARPITTSGGLGPTATVVPYLNDNDTATVASFLDGRSVVVWSVYDEEPAFSDFPPDRSPIRGRTLLADGHLGRVFTIASRSDLSSSGPQVVAHGNRAVTAWRAAVRAPRAHAGFRLAFKSRLLTPTGPAGTIQTLQVLPEGTGTLPSSWGPVKLAVGRDGRVAALWPTDINGRGAARLLWLSTLTL